ncbi:hypothetical protein [Xanthovirga aplysinae]|uniref:hypothetical protein n=1 Tax=Xanthovirga aplysinae TaxID=2529853 RepID=UPI0012BBFE98|nr:hypothetical protein [Xanthovirga aplysinae]MTI29699.1 hypothetical protein [Xanthovirga aplysinae]
MRFGALGRVFARQSRLGIPKPGIQVINKVKVDFGGTGRGAEESFNEERDLHATPLNPNVRVNVNEETVILRADGPGFTDPETGRLQGGEESTMFNKAKSQILGRGRGSIQMNAEAMLDEVTGILGENPADELEVDVRGYSRGAVAGAEFISQLKVRYPKLRINAELLDPVAGPMDHGGTDVKGTNTAVQYSLENHLPGFWAYHVRNPRSVILANGGHDAMARGNYSPFRLWALGRGVYFRNFKGEFNKVNPEAAARELQERNDQGGSYMETGLETSRFTEIERAVANMSSSSMEEPD